MKERSEIMIPTEYVSHFSNDYLDGYMAGQAAPGEPPSEAERQRVMENRGPEALRAFLAGYTTGSSEQP